MAKTDFAGDRFGDWVVMDRAPSVGRKRMWHVTNSQTDETRVVPQTELKNLTNEDDVAKSAEITERVLSHNDPFGHVSPGTPDDDDEYPFEPVFLNPFDVQMSADFDDDNDGDPPLGEPEGTVHAMATAFADSVVDSIADHLISFLEEWRVLVKEDLAKSITVTNRS